VEQTEYRHPQVHAVARAIHHNRYSQRFTALVSNNVQCLLNPAASGNDILNHQQSLAPVNPEPAPEHQAALFLFSEDETQVQLPGHFLANHQAAHRRRDDGRDPEVPDPGCQGRAELFHHGHLLKRKGTLEILSTVQAAPEHKMSLEQGPAFAENSQGFRFRHDAMISHPPRGIKREKARSNLGVSRSGSHEVQLLISIDADG
jgi:hypothetical protein